jgi:hypothetical protein
MVVETRSKANSVATKSFTSTFLAQVYIVKWFLAFGVGLLHTLLVSLTYRDLDGAYMDELFHVNQTEAYCRGDWR